ncbi:MAG: hypothetical protein HYS34_10600 [Acidobacteria bacterium]|nr:hypothetical protein [Acidobacteriota bacterium]
MSPVENMVTRAIANTKGNFGLHTATDAEFSTTMRTGGLWVSAAAGGGSGG